MTQPTVPTDLRDDRLEDFRCRDRADAMSFALQRYRRYRRSASVASVVAENTGDMDYFLAHTATGDHPPCRCPIGQGHNDPEHFDQEEGR